MASGWLCTIQYLFIGVCLLPLPAGAATVAASIVPSAESHGVSAGMTDFPSLELVLLIGIVLLALVVIARSGNAP